jgi:O-antigen/teichoic acid export membrane protein
MPFPQSKSSQEFHMTVAEVGVADIKRLALRGGLAKLISQAGNSALRFGFLIVAARLLEPKDFGLVAMVTAFTAVLDLFATAGLSSATVQKSSIKTEQISTLFWINIVVGVMLSIVCVLSAPLVVAFYHEPRLFWVTVVMGAGFLFNAAGVQHLALLQRQMRYHTLAAIEFSCQLATFALAVCLALAGYGYWALVAAAITLPAAMTISTWTATGWIPGLPKRNADIRSMLHFGGTLTLNGVVSYLTVNFDKFVVGRIWGATALGNYSVASQLINTPVSHLNTALGGVTFSALSRLQGDAVRFRSYFLKGYALNVSLTLPVIVFSAVFAQEIVLVALGQKWADAAIFFRMLAPAVLFIGIVNPLVWVLFASHRQVRSLKIALVIAVLVPIGCLAGLPYGPQGVAAAYSAAMMLWLVPHVAWCLYETPITPIDLLRTSSSPLLSAIVAAALAYAACAYFDPLQTPLSRLALAGGVMTAVYTGLMVCIMGKDFYLDLVRAMRNTPYASTETREVERQRVSL